VVSQIRLVTDKVTEYFFSEFMGTSDCCKLTIISPWISDMGEERYDLLSIVQKIERDKISTLVISRRPVEPWHSKAISILEASDFVQIRYNDNLHAKIYVCENARNPSFALLGSANLTSKGIFGYEAGVFVIARDYGEDLFNDLLRWTDYLWGFRDTVEAKNWNPRRPRRPECM